jgi:uncharacterized protein (TIGR03067 family)
MRATASLVGVLLLGLVVARADDAKESALLEGEWSMVSGESGGQAMSAESVKIGKRVAKDGVTTITFGNQTYMAAKYTIDPTKKPKTIDYAVTEGPAKGKTQLGIYEPDGDTVKFCFAAPGKERPTEFKTAADSERTLSVWKRVKK